MYDPTPLPPFLPGSVDFVCYDSILSVAPILRSHRVAARSLAMWRIEAEKRDQALYQGKRDFGFAGPCPPLPSFPLHRLRPTRANRRTRARARVHTREGKAESWRNERKRERVMTVSRGEA